MRRDLANSAAAHSHFLAIIVSLSLVAGLSILALSMGCFLWYRRRPKPEHEKPVQPTIDLSSTNKQPEIQETRGLHVGDAAAAAIGSSDRRENSDCAWCYISSTGLCKWCSGEAADDEESNNDGPSTLDQLAVDERTIKDRGWRSVLNSPTPRNSSLISPSSHPPVSLRGSVNGANAGDSSTRRSHKHGSRLSGTQAPSPSEIETRPSKPGKGKERTIIL